MQITKWLKTKTKFLQDMSKTELFLANFVFERWILSPSSRSYLNNKELWEAVQRPTKNASTNLLKKKMMLKSWGYNRLEDKLIFEETYFFPSNVSKISTTHT